MPMQRELYPDDWDDIAHHVKEQAGWHCAKCQKPCRKPGVEWDAFVQFIKDKYPEWHQDTFEITYNAATGQFEPVAKLGRFVLTVAHLDQKPANNSPDNLRALCSVCHLAYDRPYHVKNALRTKRLKKLSPGQIPLPFSLQI